jgi:predicted amidohydrolase
MVIALAQIESLPGQIEDNLQNHNYFVKKAADRHADFILFPELSITGYEPKLAASLATTKDDPVFYSLQKQSDTFQITIGIGMPIKGEKGIYIGLIIFSPNAPRQLYCKRFLHKDELPYFIPGEETLLLQKDAHRIGLAICYESLLPSHVKQAAEAGATLYIASVAKPEKGIAKAFAHYPEIARKYQMPVLMVNGVGPMDDFIGAGQSGAWDQNGKLIGQLGEKEEVLLMIDLRSLSDQ